MNLNSVLLFSENPQKLSDFYRGVIGKDPVMGDQDYTTFEAGQTYLTIGPHDKVTSKNPNPERVMLNFETEEVQSEFDRLTELGATVIREPYTMDEQKQYWIATLADPDGNYFQVVSPIEM